MSATAKTTPLRTAATAWSAARAAIIARVSCTAVCELAGMQPLHGRWPCPNPTHKGQERGPDLTFNRDATGWRCHACNAGGSVFDLAIHVGAARDIGDAIKVLAALAGVELPTTKWQPAARQQRGVSDNELERDAATVPAERASEIRRRFAAYTQRHFTADTPGAAYLESRQIPFYSALEAGCGWVADPDSLNAALRGKYDAAELRAAGLIGKRGGFLGQRHRLVIADRVGGDGSVLALRSIAADAKPKEIAVGRGVFGVSCQASRNRLSVHTMWVWCEGTTDWLTALSLGFAAIGIPGAGQWRYGIDAMRKLRTVAPSMFDPAAAGKHLIYFDADEAGQRGATEFAKALMAELPPSHMVRVAKPPGQTADGSAVKDLNDCVRLGATAEELRQGWLGLFQ